MPPALQRMIGANGGVLAVIAFLGARLARRRDRGFAPGVQSGTLARNPMAGLAAIMFGEVLLGVGGDQYQLVMVPATPGSVELFSEVEFRSPSTEVKRRQGVTSGPLLLEGIRRASAAGSMPHRRL